VERVYVRKVAVYSDPRRTRNVHKFVRFLLHSEVCRLVRISYNRLRYYYYCMLPLLSKLINPTVVRDLESKLYFGLNLIRFKTKKNVKKLIKRLGTWFQFPEEDSLEEFV
jgi:hypothetical protein